MRPGEAEQPTRNGVEPRDHQHQDGGEVKVPAQADLHEEGPRVQVRLCVEEETQGLGEVTSRWLGSTQGLLQEQDSREIVNTVGTARTLHCTRQEDTSQSQRWNPGSHAGGNVTAADGCHRPPSPSPQRAEQAAPAVICNRAQSDAGSGTGHKGQRWGALGHQCCHHL